MINSTTVRYYICAQVKTDWDHLPSETKWLGCTHPDRNPPQWTTEELAYSFFTLESAQTYFKNGKGYEIGLAKPILDTVHIVEKTLHQVITTEIFSVHTDT